MKNNIIEKTITNAGVEAAGSASETFDLTGAETFSAMLEPYIFSETAKTFSPSDVTVGADTITETAHGYITGSVGQLTTVTTLPAGLSLATDYYVILVDANTYSLATSYANAVAGTAIDITDQGTGDHTFTPVGLTTATAQLQISNDGTNWLDSGSAVAITTTALKHITIDRPANRYARIFYDVATGIFTVVADIVTKGN